MAEADMAEQDNGRPASLWRAFSIWPSEAIDAVLARESQTATLAVAFLTSALNFLVVLWAADSFAGAPPLVLTAFLAAATLFSAVVVAPAFYAQGWFVQAIARLFGGRGSPKAARAAPVWGQFPATVALAVAVLASLAGASLLAAFAAAAATYLCFPWGLLRSTWMLARTHALSRFRAFLSLIVATALFLGVALLLAAGFRTLVAQAFSIPSGAMIPTLVVGDYFFLSKSAYGYSQYSLPGFLDFFPRAMPGRIFASEPKRGDVVVFKLPSDGATDYVKRVIGLPGDKIQLVHARLVINGEIVPREQIALYPAVNHFGKPEEAPHYIETLPGGVKHEIIQIDGDDGTFDNTRIYEVPSGHYFVMGDNRDNSSDSRLAADLGGVGYVPFENLLGKAAFIFKSNDPGRLGAVIR
jgi:signal peptidase I